MTDAELVLAALELKQLDRAGWLRVGIERPESVAAHSWGMALLALVACPPTLDRERVLALCVLHDLAEVIVGDLTPYDGVSKDDKRARERTAAARLFAGHPHLWGLWEDYEQQRSAEARFVKSLDRVDMGLQATAYAAQADTTEFLRSAHMAPLPERLESLLAEAASTSSERTERSP